MTLSWFSFATVLSLFAAAFLHPCQAQPEFVSAMAYARVGPYLYFNGGYYTTSTGQKAMTSQLAALPLNVPWSVDSPPWKLLAPGNESFHHAHHTAVAASGSRNLVAFLTQPSLTVGTYNIQQNTWRYDPVLTAVSMGPQFRPVLDPVSGAIYIAGSANMSIYDPGTNDWQTQSIPINPLTQRIYGGAAYGGAVYNEARYSIMYFGGYIKSVPERDLYITEYDIGTRSWSIFNATGDVPPRIADFCGVSSEDGDTIAVFGGRIIPPTSDEPDFFSNLLYLLDVQRRVWSKVPVVSMRANTGCQIVGDQFLAWGGASAKDVILPTQPPLVYDLTKKQWVDTYTAPARYQTTSRPAEHSNFKESASEAPNLGTILGGSLGGVLVIALSIAFYFYKASIVKKDKQTDTDSRSTGFKKGDGQDSVTDDLKRRKQEPQGSAPGPHNLLPSRHSSGSNDYRLTGPREGEVGSQGRLQGPQMLSSESLQYPHPSSLPGPQYVPPPAAAYSPSQGSTPPLAPSYYVHDSKSQEIPMATSFLPINGNSAYSPGVPYPVVIPSTQPSAPHH